MTGQQMCETIAWAEEQANGRRLDPEAIWNMSPSGELWYVIGWYEDAEDWLLRGLPVPYESHEDPPTAA